MKKVRIEFVFLAVLSSCSSMYIPSPKNIPLFEEKGEVQIEAGTSTNSIFAAGSYAFSEKYAFITNFNVSFRNFSKKYDFGPDWHYAEFYIFPMPGGSFAHRSIETGIGRYNMASSSSWKREIFAGTGYGWANEGKDWKNRYLQGFVQANAGKRFKNFEIGNSLRLSGSYFMYQMPERDYSTGVGKDVILYRNFVVGHAEWLMCIRFGGKYLKGFVRSGLNFAYPLYLSSSEYKTIWLSRGRYWNFTLYHISIGISYRFP